MKLTIFTSAVAGLAAITMATAPLATAGPEEDFLKYIADHGITWPAGKTQAIIDAGHGVCEDWQNGATFSKEVNDVTSATNWTDQQAGVFIGAATGAFCPQYESKIK
ncbi:MAG TPA: DUF732 domain-containing protein [Mycobacterium sp.]|nr:DUF732 domain-containing protein [Mycobacterium sp.]